MEVFLIGFAKFCILPDVFIQELPELFNPLFQMLPLSSLFRGIIEDMEVSFFCIILLEFGGSRCTINFVSTDGRFSLCFKGALFFKDQ